VVDASAFSLVRVIRSACSRIAFIHCWGVGEGICCSRIGMVLQYELDRVVKMSVFMASTVILSKVPINFLPKSMGVVEDWVIILSRNGRSVLNYQRSCVRPIIFEALSSRSLSASRFSRASSISSQSGSSSFQHPRCISAITLLAL
jgi:hypothetical protein